MPIYAYKCKECEIAFEVLHSMKEKCVHCNICKKDSLISTYSPIRKKKKIKDKKVGDIVKKYIEDTKEELKEEKEKLKKEEFE